MAYSILYIFLYLVTLVLAIYRIGNIKKKEDLLFFLLFLICSAILFAYEKANISMLLSGVVIFNVILFSSKNKLHNLYVLIGLVYVIATYNLGMQLVAQSAVIGLLSEVRRTRQPLKSFRDSNKEREVNRDIIQILSGIVFILFLYYAGMQATGLALISILLIGSILTSYVLTNGKSKAAKTLYVLERKNSIFGHGALWLGIGCIFAFSFLSQKLTIVVFIALFIGDALATIVGINYGKTKLPYNKNKSVAGLLVYLASTAVLSYPFIGALAIPVAVIAAFVESLDINLDDNFSVSLALVILFAVLMSLNFV